MSVHFPVNLIVFSFPEDGEFGKEIELAAHHDLPYLREDRFEGVRISNIGEHPLEVSCLGRCGY